jgi:hypothetical protein
MKVVVWLGIIEGTQFLFAGGKVYEGIGPTQTELKPSQITTLEKIREEAGDDEIGLGIPSETMCYVYEGIYGDSVIVGDV